MKIERVLATPVSLPLAKPVKWATGNMTCQAHVLVRVQTDEGIEGIAEAIPREHIYGETQPGMVFVINTMLAPLIEGLDCFDLEKIHEKMAYIKQNLAAKGGIDVAIWDAIGKKLGMPLYKLFGGYRDSIEPSRTLADGRDGRDARAGKRAQRTRLQGVQGQRGPQSGRGHRARGGPARGGDARHQALHRRQHELHVLWRQESGRRARRQARLLRGAHCRHERARSRPLRAFHRHPHHGRREQLHHLRHRASDRHRRLLDPHDRRSPAAALPTGARSPRCARRFTVP